MAQNELHGFVYRVVNGVPKRRFPPKNLLMDEGRVYHKLYAQVGEMVIP